MHYNGNVVIEERDINNLPATIYTRGPDLSGTLQSAGGIGGLLARTDVGLWTLALGLAHAYYHSDANGNITCLINTNQSMVAAYLYDPFGNILSQSGSLAAANLYRFSSKELHPNSGLVYYLYRYYDPNLQRWPNRDPLGDTGSLTYVFNSDRNLSMQPSNPTENWQGNDPYSFARNAPVVFVDKDGRVFPIIIGGAVVAVGAAEAVAATFGISLVACLATPPCSQALKRGLSHAIDKVSEWCRPKPQEPDCTLTATTLGLCLYSCSSPVGKYQGAINRPSWGGPCPKTAKHEDVTAMPGRGYPGFPPK